jgi:hypothetical protein
LGWNVPFAFSSPHSFDVELSTFLKLCVSHFLEALCYSNSKALSSFGDGMNWKWSEGGRIGEVGRRGNFWGKKGGWKFHG